jgi:hypothetical protein
MRAALLLKRMLGEHWPCMSLIAASDADMARGGCTISVYAGDSLDTHNCCSGLCLELREQKAQQLAATMLMAQEVYEKVVSEGPAAAVCQCQVARLSGNTTVEHILPICHMFVTNICCELATLLAG